METRDLTWHDVETGWPDGWTAQVQRPWIRRGVNVRLFEHGELRCHRFVEEEVAERLATDEELANRVLTDYQFWRSQEAERLTRSTDPAA